MENIYPAGPAQVPADLSRPTPAYRRHAWLAVASLLLFIALYLALTAWFVLTTLDELARASDGGSFLHVIVGICSLFLAVFLVKALFFVRKGGDAGGIELKRAEQPGLFAFLDRIADEAGAPRPYRVFLSAQVNAAVFYDLSLLNLIIPSRKNLVIGLGLVNMLNLGEFKAVCAHEFGHFAQRSMAVGRWVYTAQQVASHIVARRDALDHFLRRLCRFDLRVAWVGWLLSVVIWALRAVVDAVFRLVVVAQRALSREMEMQADRVAVSLTGSDALVLALHRLQLADDAWERALGFLRGEVGAGCPPRDFFALQEAVAARLGLIYQDPTLGERPPIPEASPESFRVFDPEFAQPPRMWSTHPMNHERERNAKRVYVPAPIDDRSAWVVFEDAPALREKVTGELVGKTEHPAVDLQVSLDHLDAQFGCAHLDARYRGLYLGYPSARHAKQAAHLYEDMAVTEPLRCEDLYRPELGDALARLRSLQREHALLTALREGVYEATDGVIRHRGRLLERADLPQAIKQLDGELQSTREHIQTTLRQVRSLHLSAAGRISAAWRAYLEGTLALLHYAEHAHANVTDAHAGLGAWWRRATASGAINEAGVRYILAAANDVHRALAEVYDQAPQVHPGDAILARLHIEDWPRALGTFGLRAPSRANINDWLRHIDGWVNRTAGWLDALRRAVLDELLDSEAVIAAATCGNRPPEAPERVPAAPAGYTTLVTGTERGSRAIKPTWWERFQTASGFFPGLARAVVSVTIIGSVLAVGWGLGRTEVTVYNGLQRAVVTEIAGHRVQLASGEHASLSIGSYGRTRVVTRTKDGVPVESFVAPASRARRHLVYTIAGAAPLRQWTAAYGDRRPGPPRWLAPQRWRAVHADFVFSTPPERIRGENGGGTRSVLDAGQAESPDLLVDQVKDPATSAAMVLAHVRFDLPRSADLPVWLGLGRKLPGFDAAFAARRAQFPVDIVAMRLEQDATEGAAHEEVCARQRTQAERAPDQSALAYLATRCMSAATARDEAFEAGHRRWPHSPWFAFAAGSVAAAHGRYQEALDDYRTAMAGQPALQRGLAPEAFRLGRLLGPRVLANDASRWVREAPSLRALLALERGPDGIPAGPYRALALLAVGRIDEALRESHGTPIEAHLMRLAAASKGASPLLRMRVAALPAAAGLDEQTVLLAIAAGAHADDPAVAGVLARLEKQYGTPGTTSRIERFMALVRKGHAADAERALDGVPLELRAQAFVAGSYLLGSRTPPSWETFARRVLFASERPYLG